MAEYKAVKKRIKKVVDDSLFDFGDEPIKKPKEETSEEILFDIVKMCFKLNNNNRQKAKSYLKSLLKDNK